MTQKKIECQVLVFLLIAVMVQSDNLTLVVEEGYCGTSLDIDGLESIDLVMPNGTTPILTNCEFEFINMDQHYDACFKLTSPLDCHVTIEYWSFDSVLEKNVTCGEGDLGMEHCKFYSNMSVVFTTDEMFYLTNPVSVKIYRKIRNSKSFLSENPVIGIMFLVFVYIIICLIIRRLKRAWKDYKRINARSEVIVAQCVPLRGFPIQPGAPGFQLLPNQLPQGYGQGYQLQGTVVVQQPQGYPQGSQQHVNAQGSELSQSVQQEYQALEGCAQGRQLPAYVRQESHPSTAEAAGYDPPPSYDEATRNDLSHTDHANTYTSIDCKTTDSSNEKGPLV